MLVHSLRYAFGGEGLVCGQLLRGREGVDRFFPGGRPAQVLVDVVGVLALYPLDEVFDDRWKFTDGAVVVAVPELLDRRH